MSRFTRKWNTREPHKIIHIFTEGKKTEPNYFNSIKDELHVTEIDIKVRGLADHALPMVEWVIARKEESDTSLETEWWVVMDRDEHADFDKSVEIARKNGVEVAYSNECFELWFILHYEFLNTAIGRTNYYSKLTDLLGAKYDKSESDIYEIIKGKEKDAIRNAKNLEKMHEEAGIASPQKRDPSTLVYKLVERLRSLKA